MPIIVAKVLLFYDFCKLSKYVLKYVFNLHDGLVYSLSNRQRKGASTFIKIREWSLKLSALWSEDLNWEYKE